jgi:transposase-like protein
MTKNEAKPAIASVNELFAKSPDGLREIVRAVMQEMLEAEMTDALGAGKGERTESRLGYRSGYYTRTLDGRPCFVMTVDWLSSAVSSKRGSWLRASSAPL